MIRLTVSLDTYLLIARCGWLCTLLRQTLAEHVHRGAGSRPAACRQRLEGKEMADCPAPQGQALKTLPEEEGPPFGEFGFPFGKETFPVPPDTMTLGRGDRSGAETGLAMMW